MVTSAQPITAEGTWVLITTYRRPELLRKLLESLSRVHMPSNSELTAPRIIVVDNAPEPEVLDFVAEIWPTAVRVHQSEPGVVAARNASLEAVPESAEAVIFIDDDEEVTPGWLLHLLDAINSSGADAVSGPVQPVFVEGAPAWLSDYGYVRRTDRESGPGPMRLATNNTLVRAEWFIDEGMRFNPAFNFTGGEDSDLFDRLRERGGVFWWSAEAVVTEEVPAERATKYWLRSRALRGGTVRALKHRQRYGSGATVSARIAVEGSGRAAYGALRRASARLRRRPVTYTDDYYLCEGVGMLKSLIGSDHEEYARPAPQPNAPSSHP